MFVVKTEWQNSNLVPLEIMMAINQNPTKWAGALLFRRSMANNKAIKILKGIALIDPSNNNKIPSFSVWDNLSLAILSSGTRSASG